MWLNQRKGRTSQPGCPLRTRSNIAISRMGEGLKRKILSLRESAGLQGIIAVAGMTGTLISLQAMKALPFGFPKILLSSAAAMPAHASQFAEYFALKDITIMHTVVDTVGMNRLVRALAVNGANAISGMVESERAVPSNQESLARNNGVWFLRQGCPLHSGDPGGGLRNSLVPRHRSRRHGGHRFRETGLFPGLRRPRSRSVQRVSLWRKQGFRTRSPGCCSWTSRSPMSFVPAVST